MNRLSLSGCILAALVLSPAVATAHTPHVVVAPGESRASSHSTYGPFGYLFGEDDSPRQTASHSTYGPFGYLFGEDAVAEAPVPSAKTQQAAASHHTVVPGDEIKWGPAPPSLPPGVQAAALLGSPAKEGPFVLRLKFPAGFVVPPHRHSKDEFVVVLSGSVTILAGEAVDRDALNGLPAGTFIHLPAGMAHYLWAETESVVQVNGIGPFDVTYVNPKDDPRAGY